MNLAEGDFGDDGDVSESERSLGGGKPLPRVPLIKRIENSKGAQSADFLRPGTSKQGLFTRNKASPSAAPLPVGYPTAGNPPIITAPSKRPVPREKRRSKSMTQDDIDKIREHMGKEPVPAEMKRSSQNSEMDFDNVNAFPAGKPSGGSAGKSLGSKIAAFLGSDSDSSRRKSARGIMPTVDSSRTARPVGHPQLRRSKSFNTLAVEKSFRDQMTEDSVGDSRPLPQTATAQKADNGRFFPRPSSRLPASAQAASSASAYSTLPNKSFGDADSAKNTNSIPEENPAEQQESGYPKRESFRNRALPVTKNTYSNTSSPSTDLVLTNKNLVQVAERGGLRRSKSFSGTNI